MPDSTQAQTQQLLQNLTGAQTSASPAGVAGNINNGNPGTVYNIPPQADAAGNWWNPGRQAMNPLVANILSGIHGTGQPGQPLPPGGTTGTGVPLPPATGPQLPPDALIGGKRYSQPWEDMGGTGAWCVAGTMFLEGAVRASKAVVGLVSTTHTPEEGFKLHAIDGVAQPVVQPCVEIETESGAILVCSVTTPFTLVGSETDDNTLLAPAMLGELVYVKRGKKTKPEKVIRVDDAGDQEVVPISYGGRSFPAGKTKGALIYSHNMRKIEGSGVDLVGLRESVTSQFGQSWGNTPYITTAGQLQGMSPAEAAAYAGGQAYQTGGSLYTGGNVPLPGQQAPPAPAKDGEAPPAAPDPNAPYGYDPHGNPLVVPLTAPGTVQGPGTNNMWQNLFNQAVFPIFNEGGVHPVDAIKNQLSSELSILKEGFNTFLNMDD